MAGKIYVARTAFWFTDRDGTPRFIGVGTRVREGHSILEGRHELFRDDVVLEPEPEDETKAAPAVRRGRPPKAPEGE